MTKNADGETIAVTNPGYAQYLVKHTPPYALTNQHIKALKRAIRAEGYAILSNGWQYWL
jgi:hypothetical protein